MKVDRLLDNNLICVLLLSQMFAKYIVFLLDVICALSLLVA